MNTVAVSVGRFRLPISAHRVATVARAVLEAEHVRDALLSVTFVTTPAIRRLNREHLGRSGSTDVIAFGFRRSGRSGPVIGDVYIAPDVARKSARDNDVPVRQELIRLVVHGTLHVLGHEHPDGLRRTASAMWRKQERLVIRLARAR